MIPWTISTLSWVASPRSPKQGKKKKAEPVDSTFLFAIIIKRMLRIEAEPAFYLIQLKLRGYW